ncbi:MAG TPA: carboxypeptidase-like regulatory domain-containing protein [Vicinamibacterales bacterium]|nr:carboxypeptidase-like regulatory domain-containing protein [Vicinamibacterales bacterium]
MAGPLPPGPQPDTGTYTLSGRVQDIDGAAIPGAVVTLENQSPVRTSESDESGQFRFEGVRGLVVMRANKEDFTETALTFWVATDQMLSVTLQKALRLIPGVTLRGIIQGPPCDPNWDAQAPCVRVSFTPSATGLYELHLTWKGPSAVDLLIDGQLYEESYNGQIRARVQGHAGVRLELRMHAYHLPYLAEPFELTASLATGS